MNTVIQDILQDGLAVLVGAYTAVGGAIYAVVRLLDRKGLIGPDRRR